MCVSIIKVPLTFIVTTQEEDNGRSGDNINIAEHVKGTNYYCIAGKFGGELNLADCLSNRQIKIPQNFLLTCIHMAIPFQTAKFKSANTLVMAIWDPTAKFNSCQYFQLYSISAYIYGLLLHVGDSI